MENFAELRELADRSDESIRRRLLQYTELLQKLVALTGDESISEATRMIGQLYENHPERHEIELTAKRLRALGRVAFSELEM